MRSMATIQAVREYRQARGAKGRPLTSRSRQRGMGRSLPLKLLNTFPAGIRPRPPLPMEVIGRAIQTSLPPPVPANQNMFDRRACLLRVECKH